MAVVALGVHNTGDSTEAYINVAPNWTDANIDGKIVVTTAGTVTSVKMKLSQNSITQSDTMTVQLRDKSDGSLLATGSFDLTDIPRGDPEAWYTITVTGSPVVVIDDELYLRAQRDTGVGIAPAWRKEAGNFTFMWEVWGDEVSLPEQPKTPAPGNAVTNVTLGQATISWEDGTLNGNEATSYDVYYGDNATAVAAADNTDVTGIYRGNQVETSFTITDVTLGSPFDYLTARYWRIDAINDAGTTTGIAWSFVCMAFAPPLPTGVTLNAAGEPIGTPTGESGMLTVRRLIAATKNKIYYENV